MLLKDQLAGESEFASLHTISIQRTTLLARLWRSNTSHTIQQMQEHGHVAFEEVCLCVYLQPARLSLALIVFHSKFT